MTCCISYPGSSIPRKLTCLQNAHKINISGILLFVWFPVLFWANNYPGIFSAFMASCIVLGPPASGYPSALMASCVNLGPPPYGYPPVFMASSWARLPLGIFLWPLVWSPGPTFLEVPLCCYGFVYSPGPRPSGCPPAFIASCITRSCLLGVYSCRLFFFRIMVISFLFMSYSTLFLSADPDNHINDWSCRRTPGPQAAAIIRWPSHPILHA